MASTSCCMPVAGVAGDRRVPGAERFPSRRPEHDEEQRHDVRRRHRADGEQGPAARIARQHQPAGEEEQQPGRLDQAAAQVVADLPAREQREPVGLGAVGPGHPAAKPGQELPVAPDPAVLAQGKAEVARGVVVVDHDVGDEAGAGVVALDQVVRQERVLGEAAAGRQAERGHVVDPLAGEAPLTVEVLVDVAYGGGVGVHAGMARVHRGEAGAVGARQRDADPWLEDPVPLGDPPAARGRRPRD